MNKVITQGLVLMPPPFSSGLALWSREDGRPGDGWPRSARAEDLQLAAGLSREGSVRAEEV